jgi:hypothetical protein
MEPIEDRSKQRGSFLKKRTKKLLFLSTRRRIEPRQRHKSLLLLFFRKEVLSSMSPAQRDWVLNFAAAGWALEHDPALCVQPPDEHARQNKELERDASLQNDPK